MHSICSLSLRRSRSPPATPSKAETRSATAAEAPASASTPRGWTSRSCPATTSSATPTAPGSRTPKSRPTARASAASTSPTRSARRTRASCSTKSSRPIRPAATTALIANYYNAYLNTDAIDRAGLAPAKADLDAIARIADKRALSAAIGEHAARRHRSAQRDQFPHRKSVRHLRHAGPRDAGRAAALSDAGRARPARARILSLRRRQDGRAPDQV